MARNAELEAEIRLRPNDPKAYLVYADWLQLQGDPRGELIAVQAGLAETQRIPHLPQAHFFANSMP